MNKTLIKNGTIYTVSHGVLYHSDILISDSKIERIGKEIEAEPNTHVLDATGLNVYPGLIDTHTHLGLDEWSNWDEINELNEMGNPVTAQLKAIDGLNWNDRAFSEAAAAGITSIIVHTGSIQIISGQSCAVKTRTGDLSSKLIDGCIGIKGGFGGTPKAFYGALAGYPATRMGEAFVMRQALANACAYRDHKYIPEGNRFWDSEECMIALQPLVTRKIPWRVHVYKLYDILTCIRISEEFDIKIVLEHGGESPQIAEFLAEKGIPVTVGPSGFIGQKKPETFYSVLDNVEKYYNAGTIIGFQSDHPIIHSASLPRALGMYIRNGLDESKVLESMTLNGAKIIGKEDRIGSLDVGKDADIVIANGSVFDPMTTIMKVFIDGIQVYNLME